MKQCFQEIFGDTGSEASRHPDCVCQYTSRAFRAWLKEYGMILSISAACYCQDNAPCESFSATLKREACSPNCVYRNWVDALRSICEYIETLYNRIRLHTSLENVLPNQVVSKHVRNEKITPNQTQSDQAPCVHLLGGVPRLHHPIRLPSK